MDERGVTFRRKDYRANAQIPIVKRLAGAIDTRSVTSIDSHPIAGDTG
jgi:hypothetical protein